MAEKQQRRTLCLDFDGVIHSYGSGWQGADVCTDPVTPGFVNWLRTAVIYFDIAIYSSRSHQPGGIDAMQQYVWKAIEEHYDISFAGDPADWADARKLFDRLQWPTHKPSAFVSIDDRALTFTGDWRDFDPQELWSFRPWNKQEGLHKTGLAESIGLMAVAKQRKGPIRRFLTALMWGLSRRGSRAAE